MHAILSICVPALFVLSSSFSHLPAVDGPAEGTLVPTIARMPAPLVEQEPAELPEAQRALQASILAAAKRSQFRWFGLTQAAAEARAKEQGLLLRVVERDGKALPMTRDFRKGRVNISLLHGLVIRQSTEGEAGVEGSGDMSLLPYLGLSEQAAAALAQKNKLPFRTTVRDGQGLAVTADMILERINVMTRAGVVVGVGKG